MTNQLLLGFYGGMYFVGPYTTLAENFAAILTCVVRTMMGKQQSSALIGRISGPLWNRIMRVSSAVVALIAQIEAGTVRPWRPRPKGVARAKRAASEAARARLAETGAIWRRCPKRLGWLVAELGWEVACFAGQLTHLLGRPEVQRLLAATPRLAMALRPVCHMLGIDKSVYEDVADPGADSVPADALPPFTAPVAP